MDYFEARHYSSALGRFMQRDEYKGGPVDLFENDPTSSDALPYADIFNPQPLNKYSYTYNNPLRYIDPNGHDPFDLKYKDAQAQQRSSTERNLRSVCNPFVVLPLLFVALDAIRGLACC